MGIIAPSEEEFAAWMQQYYPPQPSRRLSDIAMHPQQKAALLADLQQTEDPENAAIMQQMAQQQMPAAMPENFIQRTGGQPIPLQSIQQQGGMSLNDLLAKTGASINDKVIIQDKGVGYRTPYGSVAGLDSNGRMWEMDKPQTPKVTVKQMKEYWDMMKAQAEAQDAMGMPVGGGSGQPRARALERTYGKPQPGYRWAENGTLEAIPGGPADQKAQQKAAGATDVDIALTTLRDAYDRLEAGGGITSTKKGPMDNLGASISASGLGQVAGKAFGTSNQSARNDIAMSRPALLAALMKATGMSARQMDSNVELKLWITTATDPQLDVEANRRALNNIETKYLGGNKAGNNTVEAPSQQPKANLSLQDRQAMNWATQNRNDPRAQQIMQKLGMQ